MSCCRPLRAPRRINTLLSRSFSASANHPDASTVYIKVPIPPPLSPLFSFPIPVVQVDPRPPTALSLIPPAFTAQGVVFFSRPLQRSAANQSNRQDMHRYWSSKPEWGKYMYAMLVTDRQPAETRHPGCLLVAMKELSAARPPEPHSGWPVHEPASVSVAQARGPLTTR